MTEPTPIDVMLSDLRDSHARALIGLAKKLRAEHAHVATEALAEVDDDRVFGRLARFDAVLPGPTNFDLETMPVPAGDLGMAVSVNEVPCSLVRFPWNACRVQARVDDDRWTAALRGWLTEWIDPEDTGEANADGVYEVVHGVRGGAVTDGMLSCTVDFGSAGIYAVHALIGALLTAGATFIAIGEPESLFRTE